MDNLFRSKNFWSIFVVAALASLFLFFSLGQNYSSQTKFILLPKNELTAINQESIINNPQEIIFTQSFLERLGIDKSQEKNYRSKVTLERLSNSQILSLTVIDAIPINAEELNQKIFKQLSLELSQLYNIKTELEIRIIDGPNNFPNTFSSFWIILSGSLAIGFASGLLAYFILGSWPEGEKEKNHFQYYSYSPNFAHQIKEADDTYIFPPRKTTFYPKPEEIKKEEKTASNNYSFQEKIEKNVEKEPKVSFSQNKKSPAPDNLPVANQEEWKKAEQNLYGKNGQNKEESSTPKVPSQPTQEEVRERLNKLLRGEK